MNLTEIQRKREKRRKRLAFSKTYKGNMALLTVYRKYQDRAELKNIPFKLTLKEFEEITQRPCVYCGESLQQTHNYGKYHRYMYNGVDRLDSSKGYERHNVAPCCKDCNSMKGSMSVRHFVTKIREISRNIGDNSVHSDPYKGGPNTFTTESCHSDENSALTPHS